MAKGSAGRYRRFNLKKPRRPRFSEQGLEYVRQLEEEPAEYDDAIMDAFLAENPLEGIVAGQSRRNMKIIRDQVARMPEFQTYANLIKSMPALAEYKGIKTESDS